MLDETMIVIVRVLISFFTLLIFTRILGKQEVGQLSFFDYINGITIGSIAATLATDLSTKAWVHWVGLAGFAGLTGLLQIITIKHRYIGKIIDGEPTIVIQDGKILERNLKQMRLKFSELMMLLRQHGVFDISEIDTAIFEVNGKLSIIQRPEFRHVTPKDLQLTPSPLRLSTEVIQDGIVLKQNLQQRNKDLEWLINQLKVQGVSDIKEVSYALILPNEQLYVDKIEDNVSSEQDIGDYKGPF